MRPRKARPYRLPGSRLVKRRGVRRIREVAKRAVSGRDPPVVFTSSLLPCRPGVLILHGIRTGCIKGRVGIVEEIDWSCWKPVRAAVIVGTQRLRIDEQAEELIGKQRPGIRFHEAVTTSLDRVPNVA